MRQAPHLKGYINDWFDARQFPNLFDPRAMPPEWREAQRTLTRIYTALQLCEARCQWNS